MAVLYRNPAFFKCFQTIAGFFNVKSPGLQPMRQTAAIGGVVVDDEGRVPFPQGQGRQCFSGFHAGIAALEEHGEMERAADAGFALDPDGAPHQLHQSGANGQSQAGATKLPGS